MAVTQLFKPCAPTRPQHLSRQICNVAPGMHPPERCSSRSASSVTTLSVGSRRRDTSFRGQCACSVWQMHGLACAGADSTGGAWRPARAARWTLTTRPPLAAAARSWRWSPPRPCCALCRLCATWQAWSRSNARWCLAGPAAGARPAGWLLGAGRGRGRRGGASCPRRRLPPATLAAQVCCTTCTAACAFDRTFATHTRIGARARATPGAV